MFIVVKLISGLVNMIWSLVFDSGIGLIDWIE